jgi:hypothetical protein
MLTVCKSVVLGAVRKPDAVQRLRLAPHFASERWPEQWHRPSPNQHYNSNAANLRRRRTVTLLRTCAVAAHTVLRGFNQLED